MKNLKCNLILGIDKKIEYYLDTRQRVSQVQVGKAAPCVILHELFGAIFDPILIKIYLTKTHQI